MDKVEIDTQTNGPYRLFFGVCADDATETAARLAVEYYEEYSQIPDRCKMIELYYGQYVEPVSLYIGYDAFCAFDMPLVATGQEDLYFTVCPTPYLSQRQLRTILYDHLYSRRVWHSPETANAEPLVISRGFQHLRQFYETNRDRTLGVGVLSGGTWYPQPAVEWPDGIAAEG